LSSATVFGYCTNVYGEELWPLTVQRLYSTLKEVLLIKKYPSKQMRSKIKGQEVGIYKRMEM